MAKAEATERWAGEGKQQRQLGHPGPSDHSLGRACSWFSPPAPTQLTVHRVPSSFTATPISLQAQNVTLESHQGERLETKGPSTQANGESSRPQSLLLTTSSSPPNRGHNYSAPEVEESGPPSCPLCDVSLL